MSQGSPIVKSYHNVQLNKVPPPLPLEWSSIDRSPRLKLSNLSLTITYIGETLENQQNNNCCEPATVRSDHAIPINSGIYYFESTVLISGNNCSVVIGIGTKNLNLFKFPGWDTNSFGYHNNGSFYYGSQSLMVLFGPTFSENDTVGCGVDFITKSLFFTRNGVFLGKVLEGKLPVSTDVCLYPMVGLRGPGCAVSTNFGARPFRYDFHQHLRKERERHERYLLKNMNETLTGPKMRELVAGYFLHHGYVDSAMAISRWTSAHLGHRQSEQQVSPGPESQLMDKIPFPMSMRHRRTLRTFCRRCQYGRAASYLTKFYPVVVERCPELLVQLRCRQLAEMMRRHSLVRNGCASATVRPASSLSSCMREEGVTARKLLRHSAPVLKVHESRLEGESDSSSLEHSMQGNNDRRLRRSLLCQQADFVAPIASSPRRSARLRGLSLETGRTTDTKPLSEARPSSDPGQETPQLDRYEDFFETDYCHAEAEVGWEGERTVGPHFMEVDSPGAPTCSASVSLNELSHESPPESRPEHMLQQLRFGRELIELVKKSRLKMPLSVDTEHLLQLCISLFAYQSPTSPNCPLQGVYDYSLRDVIATQINSAILKEAHNLPAQSTLETCLSLLYRCLWDQSCLGAQSFGHFMLQHLHTSSRRLLTGPMSDCRVRGCDGGLVASKVEETHSNGRQEEADGQEETDEEGVGAGDGRGEGNENRFRDEDSIEEDEEEDSNNGGESGPISTGSSSSSATDSSSDGDHKHASDAPDCRQSPSSASSTSSNPFT